MLMTHANGRLSNRWPVVMLIAAVAVCQGCGTGEYEKRLEANMGRWGGGAAAGPKTDVPGMPLAMQAPADMSLVPAGANPARAKPPAINLPDLKATYEGVQPDSTQGKQHYYCYLAAGDPAAVTGGIPGAGQWEDVNIQSPAGKWRKMRAAAEQEFFYIDAKGQEQNSKMPGTVEVWDCQLQGGSHLLVIWRVPTALAAKEYANLDERAKALAASVSPK